MPIYQEQLFFKDVKVDVNYQHNISNKKIIILVCFTSVVSAVAAHTELVRTLTTAPPAKRQPASSTGNLITITSLLHYRSHQ